MLLRPLLQPLLRSPLDARIGGSAIDADAAAWAAAVTANSGTYSAATLAAMSTFVKSAKASGYWTKLNRINLFAGDQLAAALVPLKAGGGSATDTNVNFVSGDYSEATGLTGNASSKYLRTGVIPSVSLSQDDTHLAIYNRGSANTALLGSTDGTNALLLYAPFAANAQSQQYTSGSSLSVGIVGPFGFVVGSRTAPTSHVLYRNALSIASQATTAGVLPAFEIYVLAANLSGGALQQGTGPIAAYSIGSGLTAADVTAYAAHMEAFQDALGRGVA